MVIHQLHKSKWFCDEAPKWVRATITDILCIFINSNDRRSTNNTILNALWKWWIFFFFWDVCVHFFSLLAVLSPCRSEKLGAFYVNINGQVLGSSSFFFRLCRNNAQNSHFLWSNLHNWIECWWLWGITVEKKALVILPATL